MSYRQLGTFQPGLGKIPKNCGRPWRSWLLAVIFVQRSSARRKIGTDAFPKNPFVEVKRSVTKHNYRVVNIDGHLTSEASEKHSSLPLQGCQVQSIISVDVSKFECTELCRPIIPLIKQTCYWGLDGMVVQRRDRFYQGMGLKLFDILLVQRVPSSAASGQHSTYKYW